MMVNVIDAICGAGKSTSLINMINEDESNNKYLYITPFLTEVERIKVSCYQKKFKEPKIGKNKNKLKSIKELFQNGENIVSTHALFKKITPEIIELIKKQNYILVMDEVADVVKTINITPDDLKTIIDKYVEIQEDNILKWTANEYEGKFEGYKELIKNNRVQAFINKNKKVNSLIQFFPIEIFQAFKQIYLLTYMFDCQIQKFYFDIYKTEYKYWYIKDFHLVKEKQEYNEKEIKKLIKICDIYKLNKIGNEKSALSVTWFENATENDLQKLKNNTYNFFRNIVDLHSNKVLWTTFKESRDAIKGKGYAKSFISLNIRATNQFLDRIAIAYLANRYLNPLIKNFFSNNKIEINDDKFALSELIQFIFRSAIRNDKEILVYLPSKRMRKILQEWIDS